MCESKKHNEKHYTKSHDVTSTLKKTQFNKITFISVSADIYAIFRQSWELLTLAKVLESCVIVLLNEIYLKSLIQAKNTFTAIALLIFFMVSPKLVKSANTSGVSSKSSNFPLMVIIEAILSAIQMAAFCKSIFNFIINVCT